MNDEYKNLEEFLYDLRHKKEWSYEKLAEKFNSDKILPVTVKKWEKGLKYPDINEIYKLAEIYEEDPSKILYYKQLSLKSGMNSIHVIVIKWISFILNVSFITATWICISIFVFATIYAFYVIYSAGQMAKNVM